MICGYTLRREKRIWKRLETSGYRWIWKEGKELIKNLWVGSNVQGDNMKWIQKSKMKKGSLSRQLGIPIRENIPISLLTRIKKIKVGNKIRTRKGYKRVTPLMKKRANLALTLKRLK